MNVFFALFLICIFCTQFHQQINGKLHCKTDGLLTKLYGMELAANDGTGELHKFVCELEEQHLFLDKLFPISSKQLVHQLTVKENEENREKKVANFLSEKWAIIKQEKPQLANIFTLLQTSFNTLKGDFGNVNALKVLKKQIVEAAFLLADHVQSSQDQILPLNRQNGLNMMKELAKWWVNSREFCGKCTVDENYGNKNENHGQNDEDDDGNDYDDYARSRQWQRKILQLILSAVDDGNIEALKMATNEGDDQSRQRRVRRRRKKRDLSNRAIFIIVAIVILCLLFCLVYSFCLRPLCADCCGGGTAVAPAKSGSASSGNKSAKKSGVKSGGASSSGSNTNGGNLNKPWFSLGFKTNDNYPIWHPMRYFPDK